MFITNEINMICAFDVVNKIIVHHTCSRYDLRDVICFSVKATINALNSNEIRAKKEKQRNENHR